MTIHSPLTVQTSIQASLATCWKLWTSPLAILAFNNPFDNWHTVKVDIDLKEGGRFFYRMEAKDGSEGFDFTGSYDTIISHKQIVSAGDDGRKTTVLFMARGNYTEVTEIFEPDSTTPLDVQRNFCQAILDNFKKYAEESKE